MNTPEGPTTVQSLKMQACSNCLGSHLLYLLLRPALLKTAKLSAAGTVRVTWAGSIAIDVGSYKPGGTHFSTTDPTALETLLKPRNLCAASNTGDLSPAGVNGCKDAASSILHLCWNPGDLRTDLIRHDGRIKNLLLGLVMNPPVMGGYTELFAAVGDNTMAEIGAYIPTWRRLLNVRVDIKAGCLFESQSGPGSANRFVAWCERIVAQYV